MGERAGARRLAVLGLVAVAVAFGSAHRVGGPASAGPPGLPARLVPIEQVSSTVTYPVLDPEGRQIRSATWRISKVGTNCCDVYVVATRSGRLVQFGGTYPVYSDDLGETWTEVQTQTPLVTGEGAVVVGPDGNVLGVGWDAYSGDHLQSFKYDAELDEWQYAEVPLHQPMFDRPWIAVVKGPFAYLGGTVPYATVIMSNYHGVFVDVMYISYDGLVYAAPNAAEPDALTVAPEQQELGRVGDPDIDWIQPNRGAGVMTLPRSGLLDLASSFAASCPVRLLSSDARWRCFASTGDQVLHTTAADSRGWLHHTEVAGDALLYRMSKDGGRTWLDTTLRAPNGGRFEELTEYDLKVHGGFRRAVVAAHVRTGDTHQDMVFVLDVATEPRLLEVQLVGRGDVSSISAAAEGPRFDYGSVTFVPDGGVATAFRDSSADHPQLAVEIRG